MTGQIPKAVQKERAKQLREEFEEQAERFARSFIGTEQQVLWESSRPLPEGGYETHGLTGNYLTLRKVFPQPTRNKIETVKVGAPLNGVLTVDE